MSELKTIALDEIYPNRLNPRLDMNVERLNELADSIRNVGLLEPIIVRPSGDGYEVVVGERRYRASQQLGLKNISAIVSNFTDEQVIKLNLIENLQREDLNAVEKGNCCRKLLEEYPDEYPSREALARKLGVSTDTVNNWVKLTDAPLEIQRLVARPKKSGVPREPGKLDYSTALTITRQIKEPVRQVEAAREIAQAPIHGREARRLVARLASESETPVEKIVSEVMEEHYELTFASSDKDPILQGLQTQTTRTKPLDPGIQVGSRVRATIFEPHFADLRIVSTERKRLKYFTEEDARVEGGYSLDEFKMRWKEKFGEWDENRLVHIVRFEKV